MKATEDRPWTALYPRGVAPEITPRFDTMLAAWNATVERSPHRPAVHYFGTSLTFLELDQAANALAAGFQHHGFQPGDRVAIQVQNDPQWLVGMVATWKAGGTAVAVNPMLRERELEHHLNDASPRVLICLDHLYGEVVSKVRDELSVGLIVTTHPSDILPAGGMSKEMASQGIGEKILFEETEDWRALISAHATSHPTDVAITSDSVALLTYTSGTTGRAKGAMNLHSGYVHSSQVFAEWFSLDANDTVLGIAPLFHITGSVAGLGVTILTGAPIVLLHRFDPPGVLQAVERWHATFAVGASTAFIALSEAAKAEQYDLTSLTKVGSGGAAVSSTVVDRVAAATGWHIYSIYGLTETTSPTHITPLSDQPPSDPQSGALSVGVPVPGALVRIVDPESGRDVKSGETGEIVISGPMVVPGYWNAPAESAHAIRDGWLHTGDVGVMNESGWLFVVDRIKDLINAGGYKVWPREVEDVLYQHPSVREAAVIGVPDEYRGETVKAFVSLRGGADVTPAELISFCKERISAYKYPRIVEIVEELPKNASGKLLRRELRSS